MQVTASHPGHYATPVQAMDSYSSHAEGVQQVQAGEKDSALERNVKNYLEKIVGR